MHNKSVFSYFLLIQSKTNLSQNGWTSSVILKNMYGNFSQFIIIIIMIIIIIIIIITVRSRIVAQAHLEQCDLAQ